MEIHLKSDPVKWGLILLEVAGFLVVSIHISRTALAERAAAQLKIPDLELAIKLDPSDADYQLQLGRLYRYDVVNVNSDKALEHVERAAELDPDSPEPWIELGGILEFQGEIAEAEACLRRADLLAPNLASFHWVIGNFFLLHGNLDSAFRAFRTVLAGTFEYDRILFDTAWKASGDGRKILDELIPDRLPTEFDYLNYLVATQHPAEAGDLWKRIAASSEPFNPAYASAYIDSLIQTHHPREAYQVWTDLRSKGLIQPTYEETSQNLVINGDFEEEILNMGFDWRINPVEGAYVGLDSTRSHSPSHSLLITFTGKQNLDFGGVFQYVKVEPGRGYQLRGFIRTKDITTDSGPRVAVRDAYNPALLNQTSENFTGSTGGWVPFSIDFVTGPHTDLLWLGVIRPPSRMFDNLIAGEVWLDDISLTMQSPEPAQPKK